MPRAEIHSIKLAYQHYRSDAWESKKPFTLTVAIILEHVNDTQLITKHHTWSGVSAYELIKIALAWYMTKQTVCSCHKCTRDRKTELRDERRRLFIQQNT